MYQRIGSIYYFFKGDEEERRVNQQRKIIFGWAGAGIVLLTLAFGFNGGSVQAQLIQYGFYCITPGASQVAKETGEGGGQPDTPGQIRLDILTHSGEDYAHFKFYNVGPLPSSITDIYIDDGVLCTLLYIIDKDDPPPGYGDPGVDFSIGATPGNLPDGQYADPPFVATKRFSMDSDPPVQPWGINQGEALEAVYSIQPGKNAYDVAQEITAGTLRIGYHVQAFQDGSSASFVNHQQQIPEPSTVLLLGLGGLALIKKLKKRQNNC